jgi:tyrosine-protein kinase Etk/Wzc
MSVAANQADVDIDLGRLVAAVWRRRVIVFLVTVIAAVAAFMVTMLIDPRYKGEARLLIEAREPVYTAESGQRQPAEPNFDERSVASQVEILKSSDLIKTVAERLDLASRPEFDPAANMSVVSEILVGLGLKKSPLETPPGERVLKRFSEKLDVYVVPASRIVAIEFTSEDPELAARVANAMADAYLEFNAGLKVENNSNASAWLAPEIDSLRQKVRESEEKVARFRAEKGLLQVSDTETIAAKQLSDISAELSRVRGERADAEARARTVRTALDNGQSLDAIGDVLGSTNVQRLRERESAVRAEIADLSATLLDGHPRMKALRAQLADIENQVRAETRKVLSSLESNSNLATAREEELVAQLNALKSTSAREGEDSVELRELEREAASQRDLLETYLARYRESASRSEPASAPADARVISRAVKPAEPYFPKTVPIIIVATLAAFLLSSIWVMLAELLSGRALRPAEGSVAASHAPEHSIEHSTEQTPEDAVVNGEPAHKAARPDSAVGETRKKRAHASLLSAPAAEAPVQAPSFVGPGGSDFSVEAVADQLLADETSIAISVSPEGDRGSLSAVMLARTAAGEGAKVLLVDLTGTACPTELMAESRRLPGLTDLLCGEIAIADAIHADRLSAAQIVPHGNANARRAMRAVDRLPMILDVFVEAYDLVIVECGMTNAASVARIARRDDTEIVLSVVTPSEAELEAALGDFFEHGFEDVLLMTPGEDPDDPGSRSAVA